MSGAEAPAVVTRLRPERPSDGPALAAWRAVPDSPYDDWSGPEAPGVVPTARTPPADGGFLVVTDGEDRPLGTVGWRSVTYGPNTSSRALEIGISLAVDARGRGHGSRAQRMVAELLFRTTPVQRVQALTDVTNLAEQAALERAGFRREGVLRGAQWRQGGWHDLVSYARLRSDS